MKTTFALLRCPETKLLDLLAEHGGTDVTAGSVSFQRLLNRAPKGKMPDVRTCFFSSLVFFARWLHAKVYLEITANRIVPISDLGYFWFRELLYYPELPWHNHILAKVNTTKKIYEQKVCLVDRQIPQSTSKDFSVVSP